MLRANFSVAKESFLQTIRRATIHGKADISLCAILPIRTKTDDDSSGLRLALKVQLQLCVAAAAAAGFRE